jgi:hypothetical protein
MLKSNHGNSTSRTIAPLTGAIGYVGSKFHLIALVLQVFNSQFDKRSYHT